MLETVAIFFLVVISWINWSRYYVKKQIRKSLMEVEVGHPVRSVVKFSHFITYFKLGKNTQNEDIVFEFNGKKVTIAPDKNETVLYIDEETKED